MTHNQTIVVCKNSVHALLNKFYGNTLEFPVPYCKLYCNDTLWLGGPVIIALHSNGGHSTIQAYLEGF